MIIDDLENMFGSFGSDERTWIKANLEGLQEDEKENYITAIKNIQGKKEGVPSIQNLKLALEKVTGKKVNNFVWSVCLECGCEYDYQLPMCPSCYEKGLECRAIAVKVSEFQPSLKVVRFNKAYIAKDGEKNCYSCEHKNMSYCKHFGNPDWSCKELHNCNCAYCCVTNKKLNEKIRDKKTVSTVYAKPLIGKKE